MEKNKKYILYFELYGKKMKTVIEASSANEAKNKLKEKIIFHKIDVENKDNPFDIPDIFKDIFKL